MKTTFEKAVGYVWRRYAPLRSALPEVDATELQIIREVAPYTMTSPERIHGLISAVKYVLQSQLTGDIVECGVWRGGSMMAAAKTLLAHGVRDRRFHLFDTYAGMTPPTSKDGSQFDRQTPEQTFQQMQQADGINQWCYSSLEETRRNMLSTGYPENLVSFVKGPVEQTIPGHAPESICLLRLDTDFYDSTRHEMVHLFPRLVPGGVLILDDYGHWEGQRLAVDEYIKENGIKILLNRLDYTGRIGVKL